jgi:hypothetical protein
MNNFNEFLLLELNNYIDDYLEQVM